MASGPSMTVSHPTTLTLPPATLHLAHSALATLATQSCLGVFALVVPFAWNTPVPDSPIAYFFLQVTIQVSHY